jgi:glycosyltransferase involved in cell wall biosynthesis
MPPGSLGDRWFKDLNQWYIRVRKTSLETIVYSLLPHSIAQPLRKFQIKQSQVRFTSFYHELQGIISNYPSDNKIFIFPPSLDWDTQLFQRPQQLALALARQGALVFYVQPRSPQNKPGLHHYQDRLYLCNVPIELFAGLEKPLIYVLTWNSKELEYFEHPRVVYDYIDEIDAFYGNHSQMIRHHKELVTDAELVITTAVRLHEQVKSIRPDALLCPNGVDFGHFADISHAPPPPDLAPLIETGKPLVGYYGALARWFDFELLADLAASRKDLNFVLIGPDYDGTLPPNILKYQNVFWLGVKSYAELPKYLKYFDVAIIPFKINKITHATSPLKLFEYMAAGKPVVITPMFESMRYQEGLVAQNASEFSRKIDEALKLKSDTRYIQRIQQFARDNTWDARARQILDAIKQ